MAIERKTEIIQDCLRLADDLSNEDGFLPLIALARHFSIEVVFRPLLVEAMLASVPASETHPPKWLVLIDSERWPYTNAALETEAAERPLPGRLRNTIAHEILHSLSFRTSDVDFEFRDKRKVNESTDDFIKRVERETEELSPLFLIPNKSLHKLAEKKTVTPRDLLDLKKRCGATRNVLVNRFILWRKYDKSGILFGGGMDDIGLGIGEWNRGKAHLKSLPRFANFRDARLPHLFEQLHSKKAICITEISRDPDFILNGGGQYWTELDGHRTGQFLDYLRMRIRLSVEPSAASKSGPFLFFVEKLDDNRLPKEQECDLATNHTFNRI